MNYRPVIKSVLFVSNLWFWTIMYNILVKNNLIDEKTSGVTCAVSAIVLTICIFYDNIVNFLDVE